MTIDKIDGVWAESGVTTPEPTDEKKAVGWVSGTSADRPFVEYFNYLQNRVENAIDRIIEERLNTFYDGATDASKMISTGLWDDSWGCTSDAANVIAGGATKAYVDMGVYFDSNKNPHLLILDDTNKKIEVWDPRSLEHETDLDSGDLTADLPSDADQEWEAISMCTDGTSVYVTFWDTHDAANTHQIQSWNISTWIVKDGWPSTGTEFGSGEHPDGAILTKQSRVIVASENKLAAVNCGYTITADDDPIITIIDITDGTIDAVGSGDAPVDSAEAVSCIASDGTNLFFCVKASVNFYVCSATIADPTAGCGGANYPLSVGTKEMMSITSCGPNLITSTFRATNDSDIIIRTHSATDADLDQITLGQNSADTPIVADEYILQDPGNSCFDGINLWIVGSFNISGASTGVLIKIDVSRLMLLDVATTRQLGDVIGGAYAISPDVANSFGGIKDSRVIFDGRDVWCTLETRASQTLSGNIFRLPLAALRS